jgi:hypothetical protein
MTSPRRCPYCRQTLPEFRLGVKLAPIKAALYDLVCRAGRDGIDSADLFALLYADDRRKWSRDNGRQYSALKAHIAQLNSEIAHAGYRIVSARAGNVNGRYRLETRP